jgi:hypothetical protein
MSQTSPLIPMVCPVCLDHVIDKAEGVALSASPIGGRGITGVSVYKCSNQHLFAIFDQPDTWEQA